MYAPVAVKLPVLVSGSNSDRLAVLGAVRMVLRVLVGEYVLGADVLDNAEWIASLVAGAYVHNGSKIANVRNVREALRDGGITLSLRTVHALNGDIAERIG